MRKIKKLVALVLTVIMTMAMGVTTLAAGVVGPDIADGDLGKTTGSITINRTSDTNNQSSFKMYKLYTATVSNAYHKYDYTATELLNGAYVSNVPTAEDMSGYSASQLREVVKTIEGKIIDSTAVDYTVAANTKVESIDLGYYLVVEDSTKTPTGQVPTEAFLVSIPSANTEKTAWNYDVTVNTKDSDATITKHIMKDTNDDNTAEEHKTSSEDIGDTVTYKLESTVPSYPADVAAGTLQYYMTDTLSKGLTFKNIVSVQGVNDAASTNLTENTDYTVTLTQNGTTVADAKNLKAGTETEIKIDFKEAAIKQYKKFVVNYDAVLNEYAVLGQTGNENEVKLTYTNDPSTGGTFDTLPDKVITYTWGVAVKKVDTDTKALAGAVFELKKGDATVAAYKYDEYGVPTQITGENIISDNDGYVYFPGLDEGTYTLTETKAPTGYSKLKNSLEITIVADKNQTTSEPTGNATVTVKEKGTDKELTMTTVNKKGYSFSSFNVVNEKGFTLPGTGGIGTTIFTVAGIALIIAALSMLVVYFKKNKRA